MKSIKSVQDWIAMEVAPALLKIIGFLGMAGSLLYNFYVQGNLNLGWWGLSALVASATVWMIGAIAESTWKV